MINLCLLQENYTICVLVDCIRWSQAFAIYLAHNVRDDAEVFILSLDWVLVGKWRTSREISTELTDKGRGFWVWCTHVWRF